MSLSIPSTKKIFARAIPQESAMSRAKIAPAAARSDAVRGCSFGPLSPRPDPGAEHAAAASTTAAAQRSTARAAVRGRSAFASLAPRHPGPLCRVIPDFAPCTPARSGAEMMDRQCSAALRVRGAVLARTGAEPRQNHQATEIAGKVRPVLGFSVYLARNARGCGRARMRAHYARVFVRTIEPSSIIHIEQWVIGSGAVLAWFWREPARRRVAQSRGNASVRTKIGGGNAASGCAVLSALPIWGQKEGRGRETFGLGIPVSARSGRSAGADLELARPVGRNGGFLRVCGRGSRPVGTAMLEHGGETRANASVRERRRQLCRLTSGTRRGDLAIGSAIAGAAAIALTEGGAPPFAGRPILRPLAHAIFLISAGSRLRARSSGQSETRQGSSGTIGSGKMSAPSQPCPEAGRGVIAELGLRRSGQRNAGGARVN